jgi:hypothetical protein
MQRTKQSDSSTDHRSQVNESENWQWLWSVKIENEQSTNEAMMSNLFLVDTIYADVTIPFSYVTSTVYKQDIQISPQYPESIIRIEVIIIIIAESKQNRIRDEVSDST